MNPSSDKK